MVTVMSIKFNYFLPRKLEGQSNQWWYTRFRKSKRHRNSRKVITGNEIVRSSFRRKIKRNACKFLYMLRNQFYIKIEKILLICLGYLKYTIFTSSKNDQCHLQKVWTVLMVIAY